MARPKKEVQRTNEIKFRCSLMEKLSIQKQAENSGLTTAEFCRNAATGRKISYKLTPEEVESYKLLTEYRNNFKRITNHFRQKNEPKMIEEITSLVQLLDEQLKKMV